MFPGKARMALRGSTDSRINRQLLHRGKRLFNRPGKSSTSDVVGPIDLVRGGPNRWRPEGFEEDAQFQARLAAVCIELRSVKLNQTNRALMARSHALRKVELEPV